MKKTPFLFLLIFISFSCLAQSQAAVRSKLSLLDKSPMDMVYYPDSYPLLKIQDKLTEPLLARVIYSRPQKNGREIFGELIPYDDVWRLGANEATEIEFFRDVKVSGKKLAKGRYTMYAIPTAAAWTIIFNKDTDSWGAFRYDEKKDALRIELPVQKEAEVAEVFSMSFSKTGSGVDLSIAWDTVSVDIPISTK